MDNAKRGSRFGEAQNSTPLLISPIRITRENGRQDNWLLRRKSTAEIMRNLFDLLDRLSKRNSLLNESATH